MPRGRPLEVQRELLEAFVNSGWVNEHLVNVLPDTVWHAPPPGGGRTIAAIVAHMQSLRRTFARMGGAQPGPPSLDGKRCTRAEAVRALRQSTETLAAQFEAAIAAGLARVKGQPRRVVDMLTYILQHDAHHRGQICMLARQLGAPLRGEDVTRIFGWKKLDAPVRAASTRPRSAAGTRGRS
ncbi:MAG TPA: DinB family protein [Vicinamibacterales bacterium]